MRDLLETRRDLHDLIAMAHPARQVGRQIGKKVLIAVNKKLGTAILTVLAFIDLAAHHMCNDLHPVTNTQDRQAHLQDIFIRLGSTFIINAHRAAGKDKALRTHLPDLIRSDIKRNDLAENLAFTDTAGDQLGILRPEIKHKDNIAASGLLHLDVQCLGTALKQTDLLVLSPCTRCYTTERAS